ncbi:MAG: hypothetical protein CM15mP110_5150 [Alphaproteobacteria bacterium]|nr:MAG: hypothetical protein CM15mP110_5150 [Alphaproteobacteria bacterium]
MGTQVADHDAINEFYSNYKNIVYHSMTILDLSLNFLSPTREVYERVIPIIEAIITDHEYIEAAVNFPNRNFINQLPNGIVVEVPGIVNKDGISGIKLENYPTPFPFIA